MCRTHRRLIDGVLYRVRTGVQWRDLPERFGPWETVYKRHRRWPADGIGGVSTSGGGSDGVIHGPVSID